MSRILFLLFLFLIVGCNKHSEESSAEAKRIQTILEKAEDLVNAQTSSDSLLLLTLDYSQKAKQYKAPVHLFRSELKIGEYLSKKSLYEEALKHYEKALEVITIDPDSARYTQTKSNIALTHVHLENYGKAAEIFYEANKIAKRNNLERFIFEIEMNMAFMNLTEDKWDTSIKTFKEGITYIENNNLLKKEPNTYESHYVNLHGLIVKGYKGAKILDSALVYINKGLEVNKKLRKTVKSKVNLLIQKGKVYQMMRAFPIAFESFEAAKELAIKDQNEIQTFNVFYNIARCHYENKSYEKALSILEDLEIRKHSNHDMSDPFFRDVLKLIRDTYRELKNYKKATRYTILVENLNATINAKNERELQLYISSIYDYENLESDSEQQRQKAKKQFYFMLSIALIALMILIITVYKHRKANKKRDIIKKTSPQPLKDDKTVDDILKKLKKLEENEFFLNPKYNLYATAKKIGTNTTYLSTILNVHQKMTFTEYLNALRIAYTINRLQTDEQFRQYTVKAIAAEVGYKSHSPFSRAFKVKTGMNPSEYIKKLN